MTTISPTTTATDRLGLMLFLAAALHGIVVLGITFVPEGAFNKSAGPTLEVTIAYTPTAQAPEQADFLAQAHQQGGGDEEKRHVPRAPAPGGLPRQVVAPPPPRPVPPAPTVTATAAPQVTTTASTTLSVNTARETHPAPADDTPVPMSLAARSLEMARLNAELGAQMEAFARRPRRRFISAATREYRDAAYLAAWQAKVEGIGNLNYPEEARLRKLSGSLVLMVALNPDGSISEVSLRQSSGVKVLDDAAVRIVRLAAPFAAFPTELRKDTDILHITRTWQFLASGGFKSGQ